MTLNTAAPERSLSMLIVATTYISWFLPGARRVATISILNKRSGAAVFYVIRMGSNGQNVHFLDHVDASLRMAKLSGPQLNKRSTTDMFGSKVPKHWG